jgi:hypothetical protein
MERMKQYKKLEDLPKKQQTDFTKVEGGFIRKEVSKNDQLAELAALLENQEKWEDERKKAIEGGKFRPVRRGPGYELPEKEIVTKMDFLEANAYEMQELRNSLLAGLKSNKYRDWIDIAKDNMDFFANDKAVMFGLLEKEPHIFYKMASDELKNNNEFTRKAIILYGKNIFDAPDKFKRDKEIVLLAAKEMIDPSELLIEDKIIRDAFGDNLDVVGQLVKRERLSTLIGYGVGADSGFSVKSNIKKVIEAIDPNLRNEIMEMRKKLKK